MKLVITIQLLQVVRGGGDFNHYVLSDVCLYRTFSGAHLEQGV